MSFESDLYNQLKGDGTIDSLVSTRIYPDVAPSSATLPYITWSMISGKTTHHMGGASDNLTNRFIQFDLYDNDLPGAITLRDAVVADIDGLNAVMGSTDVQLCHLTDERRDFLPGINADEMGTFQWSLDFEFWFK